MLFEARLIGVTQAKALVEQRACHCAARRARHCAADQRDAAGKNASDRSERQTPFGARPPGAASHFARLNLALLGSQDADTAQLDVVVALVPFLDAVCSLLRLGF